MRHLLIILLLSGCSHTHEIVGLEPYVNCTKKSEDGFQVCGTNYEVIIENKWWWEGDNQ